VRFEDSQFFLSPSDLADYLACPYLSALEAEVARDERTQPHPRDDIAQLVTQKGDLHEAAFLAKLEEEGREVFRIELGDGGFEEAARATEQAMRGGAEVIYQATFAREGWRGLADFVMRVDEPSELGDWSYEAWDTKLARSAKPAAVLQLVFYSQELGRIQGRLPERLHVVPGTGVVETYRPADFDAFFRIAQQRLRVHLQSPPELYPWPCDHCSRCDFIPVCRKRWEDDDNLTLVASIRRDQVERLNRAGIETLAELATSPSDLKVNRLALPMLERLRDQAGLQLHRRETGELTQHLLEPIEKKGFGLLPPPSPGDIFFDMEGDPFFEPAAQLEFLFGVLRDDEYTPIRAHDRESERHAFEQFIDLVHERLAEYPDLHVYHYATYEPTTLARLMGAHATREEEVDELLRREVLVDLHQVVRQSLRAGVDSYSLKEIEQFFFTRSASVTSGEDAVVAFERYLATGDESLLDEIEAYNEEDCRATLELRDWLLEQRREAESQYGVGIPFRSAPEPYEPKEETAEELSETERLRTALLDGAEEGDERWLAAQLLDYHRREARPAYWWYFRRFNMTDEELIEDAEAIGGLEWDGVEPMPFARSLEYTFSFPPQQHHFDGGDHGFESTEEEKSWTVAAVENALGTITLRRGKARAAEPLPTALVPGPPIPTKEQRAALRRLAGSILAEDGRWPALRRILRSDLPLDGARVQRSELEEQQALALKLDGTYLYVQGPPGSGKTYRGARLITALIRAGKRVGVTSQSHKAIHNLLAEVERAAGEERLEFKGFKWGDTAYDGDFIETTDELDEILDPEVNLIAGTAWLFAREELDDELDVLVIDEAGQVSLADALAVGTSADSLILLGDPLQLAQVTQGVHPPGSGASVLEHLLGDDETIPEDRGIFLEKTRRMHPKVCRFISDAFYEGRLDAISACAERATSLGVGIRWLRVEHEGNRVESEEEAEAIAERIAEVLRGSLVDDGERALEARHVMVVAPYNAQVRLLRQRLPDGVEIGTVDKFQGREAPVVFYSMASSSGEDVPRGLDFLLSRNRLNVAISRAQCLAYLVCSPRLLEVNCRTIEHMRLANALCRFVELSMEALP
jgi:predicted RecB family nuclease